MSENIKDEEIKNEEIKNEELENILENSEEASELEDFSATNIFTEEVSSELDDVEAADIEGSELESFESAAIEELEFVEDERIDSIIESIFFATDKPVSLNTIKGIFKGTNVKSDKVKKAIDKFAIELAGACRGVTLEEINGGYQLRTKVDNMQFLARSIKTKLFKLSGPALEVLSIVAYKQPVIKSEIDEIRGVESGHLLRALMERGLVAFEGKSDLPGKPMQYSTTRKFLEIFGLRNLKELPTLSQINELLPEGIDEIEGEKLKLSDITEGLSQNFGGSSYSDGEEELGKITTQLEEISATTAFFEQEKLRQKQKAEADKAQNIRDALTMGEEVSTRDKNWLARYDEQQLQPATSTVVVEEAVSVEIVLPEVEPQTT